MKPKQQRFVEEYMVDLNATQAAVRAGYSKNTAAEQGHQLLQKTSIIEAVQVAQDAVSKRIEVTVDDVVTGLLAEAEGQEDSTPASRVAAWSHLGKHLGMDRKDINLRLEQKHADKMSQDERDAERARVDRELWAIMSPDAAKAEIQKLQGGIAELLKIEAKATAIDVDVD